MGNNCHVTFDVLPSLLFPILTSSLKWMRASRSLRKTKMSSRSHRRVSWLLSRSTPACVVRYCSRRTTGPTDDRSSQKKESTVLRDRHEDDSFHWPCSHWRRLSDKHASVTASLWYGHLSTSSLLSRTVRLRRYHHCTYCAHTDRGVVL